jgi:hypothetical protein
MTGPGVAPVNDKEIDDAIEDYAIVRERKAALKEREADAEDLIKRLLRAKVQPDPDGVILYKHDRMTATLYKEDKLKVKGRRRTEANGDGSEE